MNATSETPKSCALRRAVARGGVEDVVDVAAANCFAPGRAASAALTRTGNALKTKTATAPSAPAANTFNFVAIARRLIIASCPHQPATLTAPTGAVHGAQNP